MGRPFTITSVVVLAFFAGVTVSFFTLPFWVLFAINAAKDGLRTDWLGFSGSVIAGAMTLVAAIIAWFAVSRQILSQKEAVARAEYHAELAKQQHLQDAKIAATLAITQPMHVAATLLYSVRIAIAANTTASIDQWDLATKQACSQLAFTLEHFTLRDVARDLAIDDRAIYLILVSQLSSIVNIYHRPAGIISREQSLAVLRDQLVGLETHFRAFDDDLANVYRRDSSLPGA
jgi:hypothetical protein